MRGTIVLAALAFALASTLPAGASEPGATRESSRADQAKRVVDVAVPPSGVIQRLTLTDGSQVYGRVESADVQSIVFRSIAGVIMTVPRENIVDLREATGRVVAGEFLPQDPHNTRLMFAPTGRSLRRGEGYFGVYEIYLPFVQVGITDRISIGGGTPLIFFGDFHPVWITPKVQLVRRESVQAAAGVIHITGADGHDAGIAYGVSTFGRGDNAGTFGVGYAYSGDHQAAILMVGGEYRQSRRVKWITENWFWSGEGNGFVSGGIRFMGERLAADLSLAVPLFDEGVVVPIISFAWSF
jgi:hypothetical protein